MAGSGNVGTGPDGAPLMVGTGTWTSCGAWSGGTWRWTGAKWVLAGSAPDPIQTVTNLMYDPLLGQSVALGGNTAGGTLSTYSWDGTVWSRMNVSAIPGNGIEYRLVFDEARQELDLLTFSPGPDTPTSPMEIRVLQNGQWTPRTVAAAPTHRRYFALAYDPANKVVVLYGGQCSNGFGCPFGETWTWDGSNWTKQSPAQSPPAGGATMAYDAATQQMILLRSDSHNTGVTAWTWSGSNWAPLPGSPPGNAGTTVYDGAHPSLVDVDIVNYTGNPITQTWVYVGGSWTRRQ
jgi:hypothetical protein